MDTSVYVTRMIYAHRGKPLCEALPLKVKSIEFVSFSSAYFYRYIFSDCGIWKSSRGKLVIVRRIMRVELIILFLRVNRCQRSVRCSVLT